MSRAADMRPGRPQGATTNAVRHETPGNGLYLSHSRLLAPISRAAHLQEHGDGTGYR